MKVLRWIAAAFLMYTRIPVPGFKMKDEDMKNCIMFLPLAGVIIAGIMFALAKVMSTIGIPLTAKAVIAMLVPLIITGGFHVDGFMDTVDALRSYRDKDKKLEILADPHIGAFSVTGAATAGLLMFASIVVILSIETTKSVPVFIFTCSVFVISRALAALTSLLMKKAKDDGMLVTEVSGSESAAVVVSAVFLIATLCLIAYLDIKCTAVIICSFIAFTVYYCYMTKKNFGGVTGDTAGWYVTAGEVFVVFVLAASEVISFAG